MKQGKYIIWGVFSAFFALLYCFWAGPYRGALSYREEMQLFQTGYAYFREFPMTPAGLTDYLGEFFTQFFNNYWIGAAVMGGGIWLFLLLCYGIVRKASARISRTAALLVSVIPAGWLWLALGNPNEPFTLTVRCVLIAALIYFLAEISIRIKLEKPFPKAMRYALPLLAIAEIAAAAVLFPKCYDEATYRLIDYDYLVRTGDWEGVLRLSDRHNPDLPMSVSATNLALGMTGQLDSRAFQYYQKGAEGLIPPFTRETVSTWITGEILFHLGMINSAQRFAFEGMEAIPTYKKSGRAVKRLAETAIIRGDYAIARKYLHILEKTLFYRKWARRNLQLLKNPAETASHPLYGQLRRRMPDQDYLFSEGELDKTLGQLYLKDPGNDLARQYLIVYPLLQRDMGKFTQYMGVVADERPGYNPLLAQQAAAFMAMKQGQPIPRAIVPEAVEAQLRGFAQAWTSKNPSLKDQYRGTLFHYLLSDD